jgi:hypothetical protein
MKGAWLQMSKTNLYNSILIILLITTIVILLIININPVEETYAEATYGIYKISNQCIAEYYYDNLTVEGHVFSSYNIIPECNASRLGDKKVKVYDNNTKEDSYLSSYQVHAQMIKLNGNAIFLEKISLKRISDDKFVEDITDGFRKKYCDDKQPLEIYQQTEKIDI